MDELIAKNVVEKLDTISSAGLVPNGAPLQGALTEAESDLMARLYSSLENFAPDDIGASLSNA